nr:reverse transcriptase domain-containing protein [Tanacetum cinerariifolium]
MVCVIKHIPETGVFLSFDDSIPPGIDDGTYDSEGHILFLEKLLNDDPTLDLPPIPHPVCLINDAKKIKSSIDDPPDLELKDLPSHLEYAFLGGTSKLPVIIAKNLKREEKEQLLKMLERLAGNEFYYFLDGFSGYFQILIDPQDQEKTTFTCPCGTFTYRRMPFGLCNAPGTFQRNLAADHLSRLENPYQGDRVEMEINDNFPHESLNIISLNPDNKPSWFALDLEAARARSFVHRPLELLSLAYGNLIS